MIEPQWILPEVAKAVHAHQIKGHGGVHGIGDEALLISALDAPKNSFFDVNASLARIAAMSAFAIASDHPFADGNKRTAYICMRLFLKLNGADFFATDENTVHLMMDVAKGSAKANEIEAWLTERIEIFTQR